MCRRPSFPICWSRHSSVGSTTPVRSETQSSCVVPSARGVTSFGNRPSCFSLLFLQQGVTNAPSPHHPSPGPVSPYPQAKTRPLHSPNEWKPPPAIASNRYAYRPNSKQKIFIQFCRYYPPPPNIIKRLPKKKPSNKKKQNMDKQKRRHLQCS